MTTARCGNDPRAQLTDHDRAEVEKFIQHLAEKKNQPTIVCICGSMRFQQEMAEAAHAESLAGRIVVMPHVNMKTWTPGADGEQVKADLDLLHRAKIRMAQEILVVNIGGYIGTSTASEVAYAKYLGIQVRWTEDHDFWTKVDVTEVADCWEWKGTRLPTGYGRYQKNKQKTYAHRYVCALKFGPLDSTVVVRHSCDNPSCVNPQHLSPGSQAENIQDMWQRGRARSHGLPGARNGNAKLSEDQVAEIRSRYAAGGVTYRQLAKEFGVHFSQIGYIIRRETWVGFPDADPGSREFQRRPSPPAPKSTTPAGSAAKESQ